MQLPSATSQPDGVEFPAHIIRVPTGTKVRWLGWGVMGVAVAVGVGLGVGVSVWAYTDPANNSHKANVAAKCRYRLTTYALPAINHSIKWTFSLFMDILTVIDNVA